MPQEPPVRNEAPDYYALLGVPADVSPEELRRVYGEKARASLNDRSAFEQLAAAYEVLKDPAQRASYDRRRSHRTVTETKAETVGPKAAVRPGVPEPSVNRPQAVQDVPANFEGNRRDASGNRAKADKLPSSGNLSGEPVFMGTNEEWNATVAMPGAVPASAGGERTQMFVLPKLCAFDLSPCPLISGAMAPDDGFCRECGVLLGAPMGDGIQNREMPRLVDDTGREFLLKMGQNTVGREGADVILPDRTVSRRHALIGLEQSGAIWLEDTGSTNGTQCDSHRTGQRETLPAGERIYLTEGMAVQFGGVALKVVIPAGWGGDVAALPSPESEADETPFLALEAGNGNAAAVLVGFDGTTHILTATQTTFGRRPGNTVVLTGDSFVSGSHAKIEFSSRSGMHDGGRFVLTDLGSTNGTKVNGEKLVANVGRVLNEGDEVTMGQTTFLFHSPESQ